MPPQTHDQASFCCAAFVFSCTPSTAKSRKPALQEVLRCAVLCCAVLCCIQPACALAWRARPERASLHRLSRRVHCLPPEPRVLPRFVQLENRLPSYPLNLTLIPPTSSTSSS